MVDISGVPSYQSAEIMSRARKLVDGMDQEYLAHIAKNAPHQVSVLQKAINLLGGSVTVDGQLGQQTAEALTRIQAEPQRSAPPSAPAPRVVSEPVSSPISDAMMLAVGSAPPSPKMLSGNIPPARDIEAVPSLVQAPRRGPLVGPSYNPGIDQISKLPPGQLNMTPAPRTEPVPHDTPRVAALDPAPADLAPQANIFDQFDAPPPAPGGNIFDQFDAPAAPQQERGFFENTARGAGSRIADLLSGGASAIGSIIDPLADTLERNFPLGTVDIGKDGALSHRATTEAELASPNLVGEQVQKPQAAANAMLDYKPQNTWQDVKDADGVLDTITSAMGFGAEQGLVSLPDMAAAVTTLPAYIVGRTGEIGTERARNDGRTVATADDTMKAAPAAAVSAAIERFATNKLLAPGAGGVVTNAGKATVREGVTEGTQEAIEYTGANAGTKKGMNLADMADQIAAGAVGGTTFGGPASVPGSVYQSYSDYVARKGVADTEISAEEIAADAAAGDTDAAAILRQAGLNDRQINALSEEYKTALASKAGTEQGDADIAEAGVAADSFELARRKSEKGVYRDPGNDAGDAGANIDRRQKMVQENLDADANGRKRPYTEAQIAGETSARDRGTPSNPFETQGSGQGGLPAVTEPQPTRMSADEIARAQAEMRGGNRNQAEPPPRMVAPEGRLPRTPEQVQGDREAGQAFDLADRQRGRLNDNPDTADTQTAGRPEGQDPKPVFLDEDFPVEIIKREFVPMANGRTVEVATVRRYDPRTGQPEDGATEYQIPMRELKQKNYNLDPRRSQDFVSRADKSRIDPNEQTFRATPEDPEVPGADGPASNIDDRGPVTRADRPEQPEGPGPFKDTSSAEAEFAARERARQERASRNERWEKDDGERARESAEQTYKGAKFSTQPGPQTQDGSWDTDDHGFVKSDKGGPLKFATQVQAAKWILKEGQAKSRTGQFFEMENHPSGSGFTVRERGRNTGPETPPPGDGGARGPSSPSGRAKSDGPPSGEPQRITGPAETRQESAPRQESKPETRPAKDDSPLYEKVPRKPLGIAAWIRAKGGIRDDGGDVRSILGNARAYPGVVNKNGMDADTLTLDAWQDGYLPQFTERPEAKDLFKLLEDELSGVDIQVGEAGDMAADRNAAIQRNAEIDQLANEYGIDTTGMNRGDFADALADAVSRQKMDERIQQQDDAYESEMIDAEQAHQEYLASRGDAWTPENLYDEGVPRTLNDLEKENADYRSAKEAGVRPEGSGGRKPAAGDTGQVSESDQSGGQRKPVADGARQTEEFLDKEIGEVIGADERAKPRDNERDQIELKARQAGKKTNGKEQQAPGGMFSDDTLFSNPIGDPRVWKEAADMLGKVAGYPGRKRIEWAENWANTLENLSGRGEGPKAPMNMVENMIRTLVQSNDGFLRALSDRVGSPTIMKIADAFYAKAGKGDGVGRTFGEAVTMFSQAHFTKIHKILEPFGNDKAVLAQVVRQVQNPRSIRKGTQVGDAALAIQSLLKEDLAYMREAGVDVGEVKSGYFPREYDNRAIMANPAKFRAAATKVYRSMGLSGKDAAAMAESWYNNVALGDIGVRLDGNDFITITGAMPAVKNTKARLLPKNVDEMMADFLITNPADVLSSYALRTARRAEWSRIMGADMSKPKAQRGNLDKWNQMKADIIAEGGEAALPDVVRHIQSITGTMPVNMSQASKNLLSYVSVWNTISLLPKATVTALSESIMPGIRSGNVLNTVRSIGTTIRALAKTEGTKELRELAEYLGVIGQVAHDSLMAQRFGGATDTKGSQAVNNMFFTMTGLHQYTEATRTAAVGIGRTFIQRLARDVSEGTSRKKSSELFLRELGVEKGKEAEFAKWLMKVNDGKPTRESLDFSYTGKGANDPFVHTYHTMLARFTDQSIMMPNASQRPYFAQHPYGRVAYNLTSFLYGFQKNVLNRSGHLARQAVTTKGLTMADRATMLAPAAMLPLLFVVTAAVDQIREADVFNPSAKKKTTEQRLLMDLSRSGLMGVADIPFNILTGIKYERDIATAMSGPAPSRILNMIQQGIKLGTDRNSDNTNTAERNFAGAIYDNIVNPAVNFAGTISPAKAVGVVGIQAASTKQARGAFVDMVAGKEQVKGGGRGSRQNTRAERSSGRNSSR